jgi:hypothetical protein
MLLLTVDVRTCPRRGTCAGLFDGEERRFARELPSDEGLLTYAPIGAMDVDGSGRRNWVVARNDGTILVYSPLGDQLARHMACSRLRTVLAVPQPVDAQLLVTARQAGLTAWRPVRGPDASAALTRPHQTRRCRQSLVFASRM